VNARERLAIMVRTDRGSMTVWSHAEVRKALDDYRIEVIQEEIADYQVPDGEAYVGELELLRALALNVRAAARRGDLGHVQQLVDLHHQADKDARHKAQQQTR
jgi:hypothetical protein